MVGIVIVSHSQQLAEGVAELAKQMSQGKVAIVTAAGTDDPTHPIGTDPLKIIAAIKQAYQPSGVIILMDIGSAMLSADMAVELLDIEMASNIKLCSAPIVEGAIAASVAAMMGRSLAEVEAEAMSALASKLRHFDDFHYPERSSLFPHTHAITNTLISTPWQLTNKLGLHARPCSKLVATLANFESKLWLKKGNKTANAKSFNALLSLNVMQNDDITLYAQGMDAKKAIAAFELFTQSDITDNPSPVLLQNEGIISGRILHFKSKSIQVNNTDFTDAENEIARFDNAIQIVSQNINQQRSLTSSLIDQAHAAIFNAHEMLLTDPEVRNAVIQGITNSLNAEQAWFNTMTALANVYANSETRYLQEREVDVWDINQQVMYALRGQTKPALSLSSPSIVVAEQLFPSEFITLQPQKMLALCLNNQGLTSHTAILARAMKIPLIVDMPELLSLSDDHFITLDCNNNTVLASHKTTKYK